jgi:3-oxoacyl-(acyl-carrier-protein) synthase
MSGLPYSVIASDRARSWLVAMALSSGFGFGGINASVIFRRRI